MLLLDPIFIGSTLW